MIAYLIDSDCAIYAMVDGDSPLIRRMMGCKPGEIGISAVSFAEVAHGTYSGKPPTPSVLEAFTKAIPLLPFDEAAAREYAQMPFKRARFDRLLAAHALALDAVVVTNNEADFVDVPGLKVENWTV